MTECLRNGLAYFFRGVKDSFAGFYKLYQLYRQPNCVDEVKKHKKVGVLAERRGGTANKQTKDTNDPVFKKIGECCFLNGVLLGLSIIMFDQYIIPIIGSVSMALIGHSPAYKQMWSWLEPILRSLFSGLWVLPLFLVTKVVNVFSFQDIADALWRSNPKKRKINAVTDIWISIADLPFNIVVQTLFLVQSTLAGFIPIPSIGQVVSLIHLGILFAMYSFEYRWINEGWNFERRISKLEQQWPYFLGFGFPLAYLTWIPEKSIVSGCAFAIFFPILIIGASEAPEIRANFDFPLHLFSCVTKVSSWFFRALSIKKFKK